jgi:hypothetical protein
MPAGPKDRRRVFPLRRFQLRQPIPTLRCVPFLEVHCPTECCKQTSFGPIGLAVPAVASVFRPGPSGCLVYRPPKRAAWASSSRELRASFEVLRLPACPQSLAAVRAPPLESRSLIATSAPASTTPRDSNPRSRSALGVSHALDGLLRQYLCGLVPSRCHVQGSPFRGLSLKAEPHRLSPAVALLLVERKAPAV